MVLVAANGDQFFPEIAYGGGDYFLVWNSLGTSGLFGSRVTPSGSLLDPGGTALPTASSPHAVAYNGSGFLTVWADGGRIKGSRVSSSGVLLDSTPLYHRDAQRSGSCFRRAE
jgi:hypothetical protein